MPLLSVLVACSLLGLLSYYMTPRDAPVACPVLNAYCHGHTVQGLLITAAIVVPWRDGGMGSHATRPHFGAAVALRVLVCSLTALHVENRVHASIWIFLGLGSSTVGSPCVSLALTIKIILKKIECAMLNVPCLMLLGGGETKNQESKIRNQGSKTKRQQKIEDRK